MAKSLRLILGDQLSIQHSWFKEINSEVGFLLCEARSETDYATHHIQKIAAFFLAMRQFAQKLKALGHRIHYIRLDDAHNLGSIVENARRVIQEEGYEHFAYQLPDEYRLDQALKNFCKSLAIETEAVPSEHFLVERNYLKDFFSGKKSYLMESFYRKVRTQYQLLMEPDGKTPLSGRWNYDAENRRKLPVHIDIPIVPEFSNEVSDLVQMLHNQKVKTIGQIDPQQLNWPVTREEALLLLQSFCEVRLAHFGTYQDAMTDRHYLLFHSKLSFALNIKLLHPLEVCHTAITYWQAHQKEISLAQIEGFIRQIIGWREYMRGVYWAQMPGYEKLNYFGHNASLPSWYWSGDTKMKCLQHSINQSLEHAYAHHIQRLMITGNFALLLGVHPDEVDAWYLSIYIDALQWVEITNTRGMSQYADGGLLATKPYVASANYIHKMGDYCKNCHYRKKDKIGREACPFNSLYWDFMDRHRNLLEKNPRIGMAYRSWDRYDSDQKETILQQAHWVKANIEDL